jgi:hypothetical protein
VDPSFSDLLKDLDFGAMLLAEARYDRWGLLLDGFYSKLSKDAETPGPLFSSVDATSQMGMIGPSLAYRAVLTDRFTLDVLGGARIWFVDTELDFKPGLLPGVKVDQSKSWVDRIIGLRLGVELADRFFFRALGDVGGFGVGSDLRSRCALGLGGRRAGLAARARCSRATAPRCMSSGETSLTCVDSVQG